MQGMDDLFSVRGKVVLITGAGSGLGRGYAEIFASAGSTVICAGRKEERLRQLAEELRAQGAAAYPVRLDVTKAAEREACIQKIIRDFGRLDVLVNNAGYEQVMPFTEVTEESYDAIAAVNLKGAFFMGQAAARAMRRQSEGKIINIGSLGSFIGLRGSAAYCATKGGIIQLTKTMALELGADHIQVNAIAPGYFVTPMTRGFYDDPKHRAWIESRIPLGRWGKDSDLSGAVLFFASRASDYVTGTVLRVDGGWSAG